MKGSAKLTNDQRRAMVLSALRREGTVQEIANRYGVARSWLYVLMDEARDDPSGRLDEAEREAAFRRAVCGLSD